MQYIKGEFRESGEKIAVVNPANEEEFAFIYEASEKDISAAVESARSAQKEWGKKTYQERAGVLRQVAKIILENLRSLAEIETKEIGKTLKESLFVDIPLAAECFNYYASFLESLEQKSINLDFGLSLVKQEPFGVAGIYLPYNVPLMIFGFSAAAALAAGNAVIIKPSEFGSLSILELARHFEALDIPKGLINIVCGKGNTAGKYLAQSDIDILAFTGSRKTLEKIISASSTNPKKIICELGGCNLTVVFSDSDIEEAAENILGSSFMKQGQMCIGTSFVLAQEDIYSQIRDKLAGKLSQIKIGDPFEPTVGIGPLVTSQHKDNVGRKVKELIAQKKVKIAFQAENIPSKGYFYPPTICETEDLIYEEFFAPVILMKSFRDEKEARLALENNPTGLVTQIWSKDINKAMGLAEKAKSGTVWINTFAQMSAQTPFGGFKKSGWGKELGPQGFYEFCQAKHIGIGSKKSPVSGWFGI